MRTGPPNARHFASEAGCVPFRIVMEDQGELGSEYPPFAFEREIPALHIVEPDILPTADFYSVFREACAERSLALGNCHRRLAHVDQSTFAVQRIDPACGGSDALG